MRIRSVVFSLVLVASTALIAACGGGTEGGEDLPACPSGGTALTYDNFGKDFFGNYCTSCHAAGTNVNEAQDMPFETQADIQARIDDIYEQAGGTNTSMPTSGSKPTAAERLQLEEWLSCGAE